MTEHTFASGHQDSQETAHRPDRITPSGFSGTVDNSSEIMRNMIARETESRFPSLSYFQSLFVSRAQSGFSGSRFREVSP